MDGQAVLAVYQMIVSSIQEGTDATTNEIDWGAVRRTLDDVIFSSFSATYLESPNYIKDYFLLCGEVLAIIKEGKESEVHDESIIKSVMERVKFLAGGEVSVWVNVYRISREYGGAEEGGWWYDLRRLIEAKCCNYDDSEQLVENLQIQYGEGEGDISSVLGGHEIDICVEGSRGESRTKVRPHYE